MILPIMVKEINHNELERISDVYDGFAQKTRFALLLKMNEGKSPYEVAQMLNLSRPGIQNHLNKMLEVNLIRKTEEEDYELTELGIFFVHRINNIRTELNTVILTIEQRKKEAENEVRNKVDKDLISDSEWRKIVNQERWDEETRTRVESLLGQLHDEDVYASV